MPRIFEVWMCVERIKRSTGVAADQVGHVAIERGPLDPSVAPEHAHHRVGTFLADSKAEAIARAREPLKSRRARRRTR